MDANFPRATSDNANITLSFILINVLPIRYCNSAINMNEHTTILINSLEELSYYYWFVLLSRCVFRMENLYTFFRSKFERKEIC